MRLKDKSCACTEIQSKSKGREWASRDTSIKRGQRHGHLDLVFSLKGKRMPLSFVQMRILAERSNACNKRV